ncbi:hypothetical protein [Cyclobacterium jeungdonense]|uniref:Uncharacterized protein n=1 Tax=Cyclobacterium jeungdonense TaxID=708087 RepID=A0ABT8CAG9_9BACT|nr:hypothetical protein [Cyclobacterium jeungdonense]MDN3689357.1 hypothetical protein [Cyclobacterium jeungdonense]
MGDSQAQDFRDGVCEKVAPNNSWTDVLQPPILAGGNAPSMEITLDFSNEKKIGKGLEQICISSLAQEAV